VIRNDFSRGPEGWCSYDYHASMVSGKQNVFILTTRSPTGGVDDGAYVWTDHTRWSADTPEQPLSILPLLHYRGWVDEDPLDLREAEMSVYLKGDELIRDGAECLFWAHASGTRWHLRDQPLVIGDGEWTPEPNRVRLTTEESRWHNSWSSGSEGPEPLESVLAGAVSYGFSFVGFSSEVMGRLSMARFRIDR
jgi:hypothetical protein